MEHLVERKRPNQQKPLWQSMAFVLLTVTALCLTTLGAAAQEPAPTPTGPPTATQPPYPEQAPATTPQPPTTQAPAQQAPAPTQQPTTSQVSYTEQAPASTPPPQATLQQQGEGPESVHVIVGHSLLIRTPTRIRRVLTGNPAVIESVLTSPRELVVTAKTPGGSSLMLWDEAGQNRTLDFYADLDVSQLRNTLDQSFPNSGVDVQSQADKVMLVGTVPTAEVAEQMLKMAGNYGKNVVNGLRIAPPPHLKQVMLKVRFAEADRGKLSQFGFNLFSTGATNTIGTIGTQQFGPLALQQSGSTGTSTQTTFVLSDLLNIFLFRPDINLGATIKLLQDKNVLQILAEPNLLAYSGVSAHFLAGGEFPYPIVQGGAAGTVPIITIQFRPYGVKLEFTGTIEDNGIIRLKVAPEVSSLDYSNTVTIAGFVLPAISTRRAETEVELKDGQSFGIAGLLDDRTTVLLSKVPGIGDIPILGQLFRSRSVNRTNTELLVLVTPTIVDPANGQLPSGEPQVNQPVQNLDKGEFDKGLPGPTKNPETK
jgi:pilus assembly protein CpaC